MLDRASILCVGTTGMLAPFTRVLLKRGARVHAIARTQRSLDGLARGLSEPDLSRLATTACDYRDSKGFARALEAIEGPVTHCVCWIHSPAQEPMRAVVGRFPTADTLRVLGSTAPAFSDPPCRTVWLGSMLEGGARRWLTHEEISGGVYDAMVSGRTSSHVGDWAGDQIGDQSGV